MALSTKDLKKIKDIIYQKFNHKINFVNTEDLFVNKIYQDILNI